MSKAGSTLNIDEEKAAAAESRENDESSVVGVSGWCASKHLVFISVISSVIIYVIGAIISGVTYRVYGLKVPSTCTLPDGQFMPTSMVIFNTNMFCFPLPVTVPSTCTLPDGQFMPTSMVIYPTPLVVVGPCFMSAGGAILILLLLQWCFCRPMTRM
ncbi:hypothetical protein Pmani_006426 [Petrolisthes manimaculis]|uniref:Transmembrane protein n=1 Tax=Petrolisthes manimaculis TaxID=1843537 RepID=A0AAE1QAY7_9EUCA|nr:hypothetical protein Pmani_006426 [Petrolisthes manimaculis]